MKITEKKKNKVYYDGRYFTADCNERDKEFLFTHCPGRYYALFPTAPKQTIDKPLPKGTLIYQIYYDEKSRAALDPGFIPYKTGVNHNYENDVILDIWRKREWINAERIGVLSWRFKQKTGLSACNLDLSDDVITFFPKGYEKYLHPFTRKGFLSVNLMVDLADKYGLFPFKLRNFKVKQQVWCNYWVVTPAVFDDYCTRYLSKAIEFFRGRPEYELTEHHRGKQVPAMTFFLEGLFSVYLTRENVKFKVVK